MWRAVRGFCVACILSKSSEARLLARFFFHHHFLRHGTRRKEDLMASNAIEASLPMHSFVFCTLVAQERLTMVTRYNTKSDQRATIAHTIRMRKWQD
jgi:hypothetical protein